jgi:DNA-binding transcriptional LysR family regulator
MVYAEKILSALDEATLALKECRDPLKGRVNFGASVFASIYLLPSILGNFKRSYPEVVSSIKIEYTEDILKDIASNAVDFGIMMETDEVQNDKTLLSVPLLKDELVFVMSPRHRFADRKMVAANEIANENLILGQRHSATRRCIDSEFDRLGFHITPYLEFGNVEVTKKMVEEDFGSSILSWACVRSDVKDKRLCAARLEGMKLIRNISLVKRQQKSFFPATNLFVDFLRGETELTAKDFIFKQ